MPDLLQLEWMILPFLACLVLSINHVYLGIHVIERRVIFVDLALAQIAALGATYAVTLGYDPYHDALEVSLFSLAFTFVGAGAFAMARMRREKVPQEAFIGIIYAAASAGAILMLSKSATGGEELKQMLVGDVLLVSSRDVAEMAILYGAIGLFHIVFRKKFLAISMHPARAIASHINVRFWDILFYMSFGVVITKSVAIVGVLLVFSYLVVPAVLAHMWSDTIRGRLLFGWLMAILASSAGIVWSFYSDYPTGPAIVVVLGIFLVLSGAVYYVLHAPRRLRALANMAAMGLFVFLFVATLSYFEKNPEAPASGKMGPVDLLLRELKSDEDAVQLGSLEHLGEIHDARIVPALNELLTRTTSHQVIEAAVNALAQQRDPRAVPALRKLGERNFDHFLKLSIARAQLVLGDTQGFALLIEILGDEEAAFARQLAVESLESAAGTKFGYSPEAPVSDNGPALEAMRRWYESEGQGMTLNPKPQKSMD